MSTERKTDPWSRDERIAVELLEEGCWVCELIGERRLRMIDDRRAYNERKGGGASHSPVDTAPETPDSVVSRPVP